MVQATYMISQEALLTYMRGALAKIDETTLVVVDFAPDKMIFGVGPDSEVFIFDGRSIPRGNDG